MVEERLQKLISQAGIASRRAAEKLIREGRVTVNGQVARLGEKADLARDTVTVDGQPLKSDTPFVYYLLNKPRGVVSTNKRQWQEKRQIVRELIPHEGHLFTVGRLDADSEGLILLTNDGDLADRLMHPRYGHTKTYHVLVTGQPSEETLDAWRAGVTLDEDKAPTAPARIRLHGEKGNDTWLEVVLREGRKRQIRRVAAMLGHPVKRLIRVKIGGLDIGHLRPGEWRMLSAKEVRLLKQGSQPQKP
ncbi:MAG: rRNA pseudouridine synthase [Anaerolineae bacterium]|nr:rRNA pseudouridine synthase [Anaerolineae bacterium]